MVVCDGFVGNVLLKFYESVPPMILALLARSGMDPVQLRRAFRKSSILRARGRAAARRQGVSISPGQVTPNAIKNASLSLSVPCRVTKDRAHRPAIVASAKESS